ncbi:MAG TPA: di-heme oxidoredictase family protein [Magnetospirillaceae bacterium]|jgi:cytochrome c peroxidase
MKQWQLLAGVCALASVVALRPILAEDAQAPVDPTPIGDEHAVPYHLNEADIEAGKVPLEQIRDFGKLLFSARFTTLDGQGRPGATSATIPTKRPPGQVPMFFRTSGPEADSCAGCHAQPIAGGSGDFVANVFVSPQENEFDFDTVEPELSMERGTTALFGTGLIEILSREMTADLQREEHHAMAQARSSGKPVRVALTTKGVSFGAITCNPDGLLDIKELQGVDPDLIVKPFGQKAVWSSLRHFTVTALSLHHGMEAIERFGPRWTGETDFGGNGVGETITSGDLTALVLFQAMLPAPAQVLPVDAAHREAALHGEKLFNQIGCDSCHRTEMVIDTPFFTEPGPQNIAGTLRPEDVAKPYAIDMRKLPWSKRLNIRADGKIVVRAFTDLKRHRIADAERPHFANEKLTQSFVPVDQFRTAWLWSIGSTAPYGHRRDITTIHESIVDHGGESTESRKAYEALPVADQKAIIEFLKAQQIVPDDTWQADVASAPADATQPANKVQ